MQPDLPWNVAGIAPEAREAARASARREGLSVGEWLTRRILRGLVEANPSSDRWWTDPPRSRDIAAEDAELQRVPARSPFSAQDSADMLARVARSEGETQNSWRRIEEHLKTLARRLEQTERSQSESSRAVTQATTEMNIAAREHAQALDQLGAHVVGLGDRLSRLEQGVATDGMKEAVKALHQGLSRLADQITETASHSATQATELAASIETVAGKLTESRDEAQQNRQALEDRMAMLAANVSTLAGKLLETRDENERQAHVLEVRVAASEHAIGELEAAHTANAQLEPELHRQSAALTDLSGAVDSLGQRLTSSEAKLSLGIARIDSAIGELEAARTTNAQQPELRRQSAALTDLSGAVESLGQRLTSSEAKQSLGIARIDSAIGGRLLALESRLSDVTERIEENDRDKSNTGALEADVHGMGLRLDGLETSLKSAIAELEVLAAEAIAKRDAARPAPSAPPEPAAVPHFDLPPFADLAAAPAAAHDADSPVFHPAATAAAVTAAAAHEFAEPESANANPFAEQPEATTGAESFLAAARRSARAATESDEDQRRSIFSWAQPAAAVETDERGRTRVILLAGLGVLIVAALVAGIVLSRTFTASPPQPLPAPAKPQVTATVPPKSAAPVVAPQTNFTQTNSAQTNPTVAAETQPPVAQSAPAPTSPPSRRVHRTHGAQSASRLTPPSQSTPVQAAPAQMRTASTSPANRLAAQANSGNAKAEELLGLQYLDGAGQPVNEAEAAKWLERAALQGEPVAAYRLGTLYERGQGVPSDAAKAVQWYAAAAKAGNRKAMHNLAVAYAQGTGTQKDLAMAAQWFVRAAALGLADSQFNLAVLYERGMGVPQSLTEAYKWYSIAASQGDAESKTRLEALDSQISTDDKASAQKAAAAFQPEHLDRAANSPPDASTMLGG